MFDTATPVRLQLSRRKGFRLQDLSLATNGLPAVSVARPHMFANPYRIGKTHQGEVIDRAVAVRLFREGAMHRIGGYVFRQNVINLLRGKNLACWCPLDQPCHADVLLEIANA